MAKKYSLKKDMVLWYIIISSVLFLSLGIIYYKNEQFGFDQEPYGLGVLVNVLFPTIWVLIYIFCDIIIRKNKKIEELKNKDERENE